MGNEKVFLGSDDHFCDSFLQRNLYRLEEDYYGEQEEDMKQDRSGKTEYPSFEFGIVFKDRTNLLFLF